MSKQPHASAEDAELLLAKFSAKMNSLDQEPIRDRLEPSQSRIREFEQHVGAALPADYRLFLTKYAGVLVSATCAIREPSPCGDEATIQIFYGFMPDDQGFNSLAENSDNADGAPVAIPIAEGAFGSQIYLFLSGKLAGSVYFYDSQQRYYWPDAQFHQMYSKLDPKIANFLELRKSHQLIQKPNGMENFYLIAESFSSFVDSMQTWDLDAE